MSAGWVASTIRGRALLQQLMGPDRARQMAASTWPDARTTLMSSFYGRNLQSGSDRSEARHLAVEATIWQLRVLTGWLPPGQRMLGRLFAAPMEIANIEGRLAQLDGLGTDPPFRLGSLAVAWPRVARTFSPEQIRVALATSVWGDPGGVDRTAVALGLRVAWARRVASELPRATHWANGSTAVLVAREQFGFGRTVAEPTGRVVDDLLGRRWREASSVSSLVRLLPKSASWPLEDVQDPNDLWRAELAVGKRVSDDARRYASSTHYDRTALAGVMALLLTDLWWVTAAIELAGRSIAPEDFFDAAA